MFTDCVIMAGGSGTRLWPASNAKNPKQFLSIPGGSSFFKAAVDRAFAVMDQGADGGTADGRTADGGTADGTLVVVAGESHTAHIVQTCAALSEERRRRVRVITEPAARNTAPALACAAVYLRAVFGPGRSALVLTSDHIITPLESFVADAAAAAALARQGKLVVFGIPPLRAETGYGYIESGRSLDLAVGPRGGLTAVEAGTGGTLGDARCFDLRSFREKPDAATAESFLASGGFYWNSGMFGFSVDAMLEEFRRSAPETLAPFSMLRAPGESETEYREGVAILSKWQGLAEAYAAVKSISIDYAVAEKCSDAAVVAARFDWLDIGSWDEYARFMGAAGSEVYASGSANCYVDSDIPVALCGVEDLIVVVRSRGDGQSPVALVCRKGEAQLVKDIVASIKASGRTELL